LSFLLSRKAIEDLKGIALFTQKKWGKKQRDLYLGKIDSAFHEIGDNFRIGIECSNIRPGYYKFIMGRHLIFYKLNEYGVFFIVRILHGSMDIDRYI